MSARRAMTQQLMLAYARSVTVRWAAFAVALLIGWLIFFWLVNVHTGTAGPAPAPIGPPPSNSV
jgi:hypothetical protein